MFSVKLFSFVLFASVDLTQLGANVGGLFGAGGIPFINSETVYYLRSYSVVLILAIIGATPIVKKAATKLKESKVGGKIINILEPIALAALVLVMTAYLVDGSFSPFLYFRF